MPVLSPVSTGILPSRSLAPKASRVGAPGGVAESPAAAFARDGYIGPIRVFTPRECRRIADYLRRTDHPAPPDWDKARAVRERFLFELAVHPSLLSLVTAVLGHDVILWGVSVVRRAPGVAHPWHSDIESSNPDGGFVTAWIGVERTTRDSALQVITGSHRLGLTVQEFRQQRGLRREHATAESMLSGAQAHDPTAALVHPDMTNGDALLFDGRTWHGSVNSQRRGRRVALLVQYATAASDVRIPDFNQLDWPFRIRPRPRPPVVVVSGTALCDTNTTVPPPSPCARGLPMVTTAVHPIVLPLDAPAQQWQMFSAFRGPTATLTEMSCHASVLAAGSPHPPHAHREEELLIPLDGDLNLITTESGTDPAPRITRIAPGSFVYYPAGQYHTLAPAGTSPVSYLMFKWYAAPTSGPGGPTLPTSIVQYGDVNGGDGSVPFHMNRVFEGPTSWLGTVHAHLTTARPGAAYAPHVDAYDVAILTLAGTVETLGQRVGPRTVIYYAAGEPHGMRNVGSDVARYLVFEFHAPGTDGLRAHGPIHRRLAGRAVRLAKRLARPMWHRLRGS